MKKSFYILEFGQPQNIVLRALYFGVMKYFIPLVGGLFSSKKSYNYLIESSMKFPSGNSFKELCKRTIDLESVEVIPLFGGITYIYIIKL